MPLSTLSTLTAAQLSQLLRRGEVTSRQITESCLSVIREKNPRLNAFLEVFADEALSQADESDRRLSDGAPLSPLDGVPVAIKDNLLYEGHIASCASRMLEHFVAPYTATAVQRLRQAGMPILGRLNMDEFAMGSASETGAFGPVKNPLDPSLVAGGSSGGSACAVSAGMVPLALGSDTGGSVRQPSALCGVVGVKPAYGAVSRWGLVAYASSMDQVGVIARSAEDAAMVMQLISGGDEKDSTSEENLRFHQLRLPNMKETRLALPVEWFGTELDCPVPGGENALSFARAMEAAGASLVPVSIPALEDALAAYFVLSCAEASSNLARYDGLRYGHQTAMPEDLSALYAKSRGEGFGQEVKRRILLGTFTLTSGYQDKYYLRAQAARDRLTREFRAVMESCDGLVCPVSPRTAWELGQKPDSVALYQSDLYTVPANLTGLPALSFPWGQAGHMPGSVGLMGHKTGLDRILGIAAMAETLKGGGANG